MSTLQDQAIHYIYTTFDGFSSLFNFYKLFALGIFPYSTILGVSSNAINASVAVYNSNKDKAPLYWLHSLLLVLLTGLAGGIIAPILLGKPIAPITNEYLIPLFTFTWYITHVVGLTPLLEFLPIKFIWHVLLALFRTQSVCSMVNITQSSLSSTEYYEIPLIGPIVVATISGCMGLFMPLDRGLTVVGNGTPWTAQGAFISAAFYHIVVNDKTGPIGTTVRAAIGSYSDEEAKVLIFTVHLLTFFFQVFFDKEANLFTPFHKLGYLIFQVTGPVGANDKKGPEDTVGWAYRTRLGFERLIEFSRIFIVIAAVSVHIYLNVPQSTLPSGKLLPIGDLVATCQILSTVTNCQPYVLTLEAVNNSNYRIVSYSGNSKEILGKEPIWSYNIKSNKSKLTDGTVGLVVGEDGVVRLISRSSVNKQDELLWSNPNTKCSVDSASAGLIYLALQNNGQPEIVCSNGTKIPFI